jgi:hypothetical protein
MGTWRRDCRGLSRTFGTWSVSNRTWRWHCWRWSCTLDRSSTWDISMCSRWRDRCRWAALFFRHDIGRRQAWRRASFWIWNAMGRRLAGRRACLRIRNTSGRRLAWRRTCLRIRSPMGCWWAAFWHCRWCPGLLHRHARRCWCSSRVMRRFSGRRHKCLCRNTRRGSLFHTRCTRRRRALLLHGNTRRRTIPQIITFLRATNSRWR